MAVDCGVIEALKAQAGAIRAAIATRLRPPRSPVSGYPSAQALVANGKGFYTLATPRDDEPSDEAHQYLAATGHPSTREPHADASCGVCGRPPRPGDGGVCWWAEDQE